MQRSTMALLFLPVMAHAQAGAACVEGGTMAQTNACAVQAFQQADTALNIRYLEVMQQLPQGKRTGLRHDQNGWIKSRTARCKAATRSSETRPDGPQLYHACLTAATQERMQALKRWLH
jgi:uncharacterized protein YecT (DUF1311 family)